MDNNVPHLNIAVSGVSDLFIAVFMIKCKHLFNCDGNRKLLFLVLIDNN